MAVRIRLSRQGRRNRPSYRVVAVDSAAPRNGRSLEILGWYDPLPNPPKMSVNKERVLHWLRHGARPSEAAQWVLEKEGVWQEFTGQPVVYPAAAPAAEASAAADA